MAQKKQNQENSFLAISNNAIKDKKKQMSGNITQIKYYNCEKKGYYAANYLKLLKNEC